MPEINELQAIVDRAEIALDMAEVEATKANEAANLAKIAADDAAQNYSDYADEADEAVRYVEAAQTDYDNAEDELLDALDADALGDG